MTTEASSESRQTWSWVIWALYIFLVIRTAWISDDAYITARVIENFVHGYGPVYNVGERVQVYTHPLWFLLLSALYGILLHILNMDFRSQMYFFLLGVSILFSGIAMLILLKKTLRSNATWILGTTALLVSRTFIDYSTSGLEYPLIYLLMALWGWRWHTSKETSRVLELSLLLSLLLITRLDLAPLMFPLWAWLVIQTPRPWKERGKQVIVGFLPWLIWEGFSLIYYGFPFPNTYYAKIGGADIYWRFRIQQGVIYLLNTWDADPVTLFTILLVGIQALRTAWLKRDQEAKMLVMGVVGIGLQVLYIVYIGGDFMQGRFFAPVLLWSIVLWDRIAFWPQPYLWPTAALFVLLGSSAWYPVFKPQMFVMTPSHVHQDISDITPQGIADERLYYAHQTQPSHALIQWQRVPYPHAFFPDSPYRGKAWIYQPEQRRILVVRTTGVNGYRQGPSTHIIDVFALVDPLLARLPAVDKETSRPGHIFRAIPAGYLTALATQNLQAIQDPEVRSYYAWISRVVHEPLFTKERWIAIWKLNTGQIRPPRSYTEAPKEEIEKYWLP